MKARRTVVTFATLAMSAVLALLAGCTGGEGTTSSGSGAQLGEARQVAQAATGAVTPSEGVTVTGTGRVTGRPDTLAATVGVEVTEDTIAAALEGANAAAEDLFAALNEAGVEQADIQTVDVSVQPRYTEPTEEGGQPEVTGYTARNLVRVTLRNIDAAGQILQEAVTAVGDAARLQGLSFELQDNDALLQEARAAAFADARAKAEQYAELAEISLGGLVSISEGVATPPRPQQFAADAAATEAGGEIPVAPGEQEVRVSVTAVWALQ